MTSLLDHLITLPILLPLATGALLLLFDDRQRVTKAVVNFTATLLLVVVGVLLVMQASEQGADAAPVASYAIGNWPIPFGIVLVADRLSAMMVLLTAILGICTLVYSLARWHTAGPSFHSLFQFLLMGLGGAFLTGDIFNLFVFFEVMLAASYGLALHGVGVARVKAGLHYIAVNLAASFLFLIGAALIYGVTGTLNMADLAAKVAAIPELDRGLLEAGAAILGIAFLIKAGMWPLGFWLPTTYSAAAAPVAAIFAIMTKVGVYVLLRLATLMTATEGSFELFGASWLLYGGIATIVFGAFGVLSTRHLPRIAGYVTIVSSGTVLAVIGSGSEAVISAALYYLVGSTLGLGALFLLADQVARGERLEAAAQDVGPVFSDDYETSLRNEFEGIELAEELPAGTALIAGTYLLVTVLLVGLPPISGFIAKFGILSGLLDAWIDTGPTPMAGTQTAAWFLVGLIIVSGLTTLLALIRTGIDVFWVRHEQASTMALRPSEAAAVLMLVLLAVGLSVFAGPAIGYTDATSAYLADPDVYIRAVLGGVELNPGDVAGLKELP